MRLYAARGVHCSLPAFAHAQSWPLLTNPQPFLATSPRETNTSACAKCESVPEGMVRQKSRNIRCGFSWCTMWEQTRTLLFIRAASASHDCSPGSDAVVPPREDKREVLKYQGAFAAYPRFTNWAAVFHSPLDISPSLFFRLIAEQPTIPYSK